MGFDHNSSPGGVRDPDFGFAFNNRNFSDRVLRIQIVTNTTETNGDEAAASGGDSNGSEDGSTVIRLFMNGMMESEQQQVTLRINASEEAALVEVLNFMYSSTLRANTVPAVLEVLVAADKFQVTSYMRHCCSLLTSMALTPEFALLYLNLPSGILLAKAFQPLMDFAKQFLVARYKDVSKHKDEIMNLPLVGIEVILSSNDLQVDSEDKVFKIALKWTEIHYQNAEERRDILSTRLGRYICFSYMSPHKLRKILTCDYFDKDFANKAVVDALFFKADTLQVERAYKYRPVKVVEFEHPRQNCMIYFDLKWEECADLSTSDQICFQPFFFGGQRFVLSADYHHRQSFKLFLDAQKMSPASFSFNYEFAARSKPSEVYMSMCKGECDLTGGNTDGPRSLFLFSIPWTSFIADYSPYFINGMFYLRAELTVKYGRCRRRINGVLIS